MVDYCLRQAFIDLGCVVCEVKFWTVVIGARRRRLLNGLGLNLTRPLAKTSYPGSKEIFALRSPCHLGGLEGMLCPLLGEYDHVCFAEALRDILIR